MCCEWEQGHCWGLGFLSEDLLQASLHQKWAWISVIFHIFLLPLSVEHPARSRSCRECRIGTGEPSYGEILVRFLCFNPCFENAGLADFATPRASCQQDGGHVWCLTGALRKNMANAIMRLWLQIRFLFHFLFFFFNSLNKCKPSRQIVKHPRGDDAK